MARFYELRVTDLHKTTPDAVVVTLEPVKDGDFAFTQGQYLTFRREFNGIELRRSYSICTGRDEGILQVGIKKVAGGVFSTWANEDLAPGMVLEAMEPMGRFHTPLDATQARNYLAFAGGSGITPLLSILKTVLATERHSRFTLVYSNRSTHTTMFRQELEDLQNLYGDRLTLIHILTADAQKGDLFSGRVNAEKCRALFAHLIDIDQIDTAFICGPEPMMLEIAAALRAHGLSDEQIRFELFASTQPDSSAETAPRVEDGMAPQSTEVTLTLEGAVHSFVMDRAQTILEAARDNEIDAPYACETGICSTCKCKLLAGKVEMRANQALGDDEVEDGYILSCQSVVLTDRVIVDYDQADG